MNKEYGYECIKIETGAEGGIEARLSMEVDEYIYM
jgi:hypothetical protein